MWTDSHAHLTCNEMYFDIDSILTRAKQSQVTSIINICSDSTAHSRGLYLKKRYPWIHNAGGTHPHDTENRGEEEYLYFERAAKSGELIAIGEIGLDYYHVHSPKATQVEYMKKYLAVAIRENLPVIFHCREAFSDLFAICDTHFPNSRGRVVLHCFTGSLDEAMEVLRRGWYISISGIVTFKKSNWLREIVSKIPVDSLLLETDCPYLSPGKYRGKRNEPGWITETARVCAELKSCSMEELAKSTSYNTKKIFKIEKKIS